MPSLPISLKQATDHSCQPSLLRTGARPEDSSAVRLSELSSPRPLATLRAQPKYAPPAMVLQPGNTAGVCMARTTRGTTTRTGRHHRSSSHCGSATIHYLPDATPQEYLHLITDDHDEIGTPSSRSLFSLRHVARSHRNLGHRHVAVLSHLAPPRLRHHRGRREKIAAPFS